MFGQQEALPSKVYLAQDDDELVFSLILDSMDTLIENQDEALSFLDIIRQYLIEYSEEEGHTRPRTALSRKSEKFV